MCSWLFYSLFSNFFRNQWLCLVLGYHLLTHPCLFCGLTRFLVSPKGVIFIYRVGKGNTFIQVLLDVDVTMNSDLGTHVKQCSLTGCSFMSDCKFFAMVLFHVSLHSFFNQRDSHTDICNFLLPERTAVLLVSSSPGTCFPFGTMCFRYC